MKKKHQIGLISAFFLLLTAAIFDGLQALLSLTVLLLPLAIFFGLLADLIFLFWLGIFLNVGFFGRKAIVRLGIVFAMTLATIIPVISMLPELTLGIFAIILQTRIEDALGKKEKERNLAEQKVASREYLRARQAQRMQAANDNEAAAQGSRAA